MSSNSRTNGLTSQNLRAFDAAPKQQFKTWYNTPQNFEKVSQGISTSRPATGSANSKDQAKINAFNRAAESARAHQSK
ncbi:MAG: hypothetical protein HETSPECPRED_009596 [Heterodermia speciosa]|uniref:Uncharacterized protein n=1 Tax=Heterodermia speciosa TaxID=116794 RepID=A0A8H3EWE3_9LECA|nr:MAG: hypothetical protein HETSPECPRED_009596 [Heterodermia speciosa]